MMNDVQFITDDHGHRTAVILPMSEWEQIEKAKDILEHVYLAGLIEERKASKASATFDDLLSQEGMTRADLDHRTDPRGRS